MNMSKIEERFKTQFIANYSFIFSSKLSNSKIEMYSSPDSMTDINASEIKYNANVLGINVNNIPIIGFNTHWTMAPFIDEASIFAFVDKTDKLRIKFVSPNIVLHKDVITLTKCKAEIDSNTLHHFQVIQHIYLYLISLSHSD